MLFTAHDVTARQILAVTSRIGAVRDRHRNIHGANTTAKCAGTLYVCLFVISKNMSIALTRPASQYSSLFVKNTRQVLNKCPTLSRTERRYERRHSVAIASSQDAKTTGCLKKKKKNRGRGGFLYVYGVAHRVSTQAAS